MPAQKSDLSTWFDQGKSRGATHMIVKCDDFDFKGGTHDNCDYPVYVRPGQDPREVDKNNHDRTMEVYNLRLPKEKQINNGKRVFNYD